MALAEQAALRVRREVRELEQGMRAILRLFAAGQLVYRQRTWHAPPVAAAVERLLRLRGEWLPEWKAWRSRDRCGLAPVDAYYAGWRECRAARQA